MIIESLTEYLETLAGYVYDYDKLVTYKWLSKELEIHVNVAKQILWEFVQRKADEETIECTFLLMGTLHDGGMRVEVVKDTDLQAAKKKFKKLISEHIYSVQKTLPDVHLLAISGNGDVRFSSIKCNECVERSETEMHVLRWGSSASNEIKALQQVKAQPTSVPVIEDTAHQASKPQKKSIGAKKPTQNKGFNNLFGKATAKQKTPPSATVKGDKTDDPKTSPGNSRGTKRSPPRQAASRSSPKKKAQTGGLDSFFAHGENQEKPALSTDNKKAEELPVQKKKSPETKVNASSRTGNKQKEKRGKKRNRSKEISGAAKKMKRVVIQSDSSEDDGSNDEDNHEEEDEVLPSPEKAPPKARSPPPPSVKHEGGKRKVLKMVDKTFEEDGYLVTKKVHVYESCSEEEPEIAEPKKAGKPEPRADSKAKKSTKQTMLTTFFKKS